MGALVQDIRYAVRSIGGSLGFSLTVVALVALGVGATTTIFSVVDGVLLRDLPYPEPDELVYFDNPAHSIPLFKDWRDRTQSFATIAGAWEKDRDLTGDGPPVRVGSALVTPAFFEIFDAAPRLGRLLAGDDFKGAKPSVAVISHRLWQTRWGGNESVLGRPITLEGRPITIVGVLDRGFEPPAAMAGSDCDVWLPLDVAHPDLQSRGMFVLAVVARLENGASLEMAQAEIDTLSAALIDEFPMSYRRRDGSPRPHRVVPLLHATVGDVQRPLWLLLGAVSFLLLIAGANVANLLVARGADRRREIALRMAIGAGRMRIIRLLLTESTVISLIGGLLGAGMAYHGVDLLKWLSPGWIPRLEAVAIDQRVLWFTLIVSVATGVLFGIAPAVQATRTAVTDALRDAGSTATSSRRRLRLRDTLAVSQVAVALVLLIGAGLLFNSFVRLTSVDPGIDAGHLTMVRLNLGSMYDEPARGRFTRGLTDRIAALPGVEGVAAAVTLPFGTAGYMCCWIQNVSELPGSDDDTPEAIVQPVTPGHFKVLGARMLRGRGFTPADDTPDATVAVLSVDLARLVFGEEDPVGRSLYLEDQALTVIGVVDEIRYWGLQYGETGLRASNLYVPYAAFGQRFSNLQVAVKSGLDPSVLNPALREAVWSVDPQLPVDDIVAMEQRIHRSVAGPRFVTALLVAFATVASLLAAGGIYALLLYSVRRRRRELGIRLALGASQRTVVTMIVRHGLTLTAIGIGLGVVGALALSRTLESLVFGIRTYDASTFVAVSALLGVVALAACYLPARRASLVDPMDTLRSE